MVCLCKLLSSILFYATRLGLSASRRFSLNLASTKSFSSLIFTCNPFKMACIVFKVGVGMPNRSVSRTGSPEDTLDFHKVALHR